MEEDVIMEEDADGQAGVMWKNGIQLAQFVIHSVLLMSVGVGGLLGNTLSVLVLSRPRMRSSINCLLIGLVVCDSALILTSFLLFGLTNIFYYTGHLRYYHYHVFPLITPYVYPLALASQTMSVYMTVLVTVERWVAVCYPFRAISLCTWSRARWAVLATALFAFLYNIPRFFESEAYQLHLPDGEIVYGLRPSSFRSETYVLVYIHWLYLVVMYVVPLGLLAVLNTCILRQVRAARQQRDQLTTQRRQELGLATMLLVVVLVFFLCNILALVANACEVFTDEFGNSDEFGLMVATSNLLVVFNSSVNFIIYVILGERFKRELISMFGPWVRFKRGFFSMFGPRVRDPPPSPPPPLSSHSTCTDLELYL